MKKRFFLPRFLSLWLTLCLALPGNALAMRQQGIDDKQGKTRAGLEEALLGSQKPVQLASAVVPTAPSVVPAFPAAGLEEAKGEIFYGFQGSVERVFFTRDPERQNLLAATAGTQVVTVDWKAPGERERIDFGEPALAATFSSTGYSVLVVTPAKVARRDANHPAYARTELPFTVQLPAAERLYPHSLAFSPDRKLLLVTGRELNEARVQNLDPKKMESYEGTHGILAALRPKEGRPISGAFHPGGEVVALGTSVGAVELWRLPRSDQGETKAKLLAEMKEHGGAVLVPFFSPNGRLLVTGDASGNVRLWEWDGQKESLTLRHSLSVETHRPIYSVSFLPVWVQKRQQKDLSSRVVAAAGEDGMIRFWDTLNGQELSRMGVKRPSPILSISFSPDGKKVAAGRDKTLALWEVPAGVTQWVAALFRPSRRRKGPTDSAAGLEEKRVKAFLLSEKRMLDHPDRMLYPASANVPGGVLQAMSQVRTRSESLRKVEEQRGKKSSKLDEFIKTRPGLWERILIGEAEGDSLTGDLIGVEEVELLKTLNEQSGVRQGLLRSMSWDEVILMMKSAPPGVDTNEARAFAQEWTKRRMIHIGAPAEQTIRLAEAAILQTVLGDDADRVSALLSLIVRPDDRKKPEYRVENLIRKRTRKIIEAIRSEVPEVPATIIPFPSPASRLPLRPAVGNSAGLEEVEHAVSGAVRFLSGQGTLLSSLVDDRVMLVAPYFQNSPEIAELGRLNIASFVVPSRLKVPSAVQIPTTIRLLVQPRYEEAIQGQMTGVNVEMVPDPAQADFVIGDAVFVRNQRANPSAANTLLLQVDEPALVERITPTLLAHILNRRDLFPAGTVVRIGTLVKGDLGEGLLLFA